MMSKPVDFKYGARDSGGLPLSVSIYIDRLSLRKQVEEDLTDAGFRVLHSGDIECLLDGGPAPLGDAIILDVPVANARRLVALNQFDMRVANSGAELIVSTSIDSLDDVFASLDQSAPQLLVDPSRADRVVAVGRAMTSTSSSRVSELGHEDRLTLLRLTEQVDRIAKRLEGLERIGSETLSEHKMVFQGFDSSNGGDPIARASLPDPRFVRELIRSRQARSRFFDGELFADPAWDMLLDLTAADAEHRRVSVTSLCIASGVPTTTALRWVKQMSDMGIFERVRDTSDKRRVFITLSDRSRDAMAGYFAAIGEAALAYAA